MKKICFFGDSYLGALIDGQNAHKVFSKGSIDFYGAAGPYLRHDPLKVTSDGVYATTEKVAENFKFTGGKDHFKFKDYDALVLVGFFARAMPIYSLIDAGRIWAPPKYYEVSPKYLMITDEFYRKFLLQGAMFKLDLVTQIRENFKGNIYISQQPLASDAAPLNSKFRRAVPRPVKLQLIEDYWRDNESFWRERGIEFLPQPMETLSEWCFTRHQYCVGSRRIVDNAPHPKNDYGHMNDLYGQIVLRQVKSRLES